MNLAKVSPMPKAGGRWNTLEITAKGSQLTVLLNGVQTASLQHAKFSQGPLAPGRRQQAAAQRSLRVD